MQQISNKSGNYATNMLEMLEKMVKVENMQANMQQKVKDQLEYATFLVKW